MARMDEHAAETQRKLSEEFARHARTILASAASQISVIDEKYADLPKRVTRLEDRVLGPKRR